MARETNREWQSIASSADGTRLAAVGFNSPTYTANLTKTINAGGFLSGSTASAVELLYAGDGKFVIISSAGVVSAQ